MNSTYHIPLTGVDSEHCALIIDKGLGKISGVTSHRVQLNNNRAIIETDNAKTGILAESVKMIRSLGYGVESIKETFPVTGMSCASCSASVQSMLEAQPGIVSAIVNLATNNVMIEYFPSEISPLKMSEALRGIGYDLVIGSDADAAEKAESLKKEEYRKLKNNTIFSMALALPLLIIGMFFMYAPYADYIMWALSTPIVFIFGRQFFINAWKQLRHRSANMDSLVALSTGIAYLFSVVNTLFPAVWKDLNIHGQVYFESAGVVIAFILTGRLLESRAKTRTSEAIRKLAGLQPKTVTRINAQGESEEIDLSLVNEGDLLLVRPGDKIPVDGEVKEGLSTIDESSITGEAMPASKEKGNSVFAGTQNQNGSLKIEAKKVGAQTLLAQIIKVVQEAQGSRAPVQKLVDRIAAIFVPLVIGIALLSFVVWYFSGADSALSHALLALVTVLVIACPCALGLATPTAIMVGIGKAAENGILIKDAESLERIKNINAIILDKTGTITEGHPEVIASWWKDNAGENKNKNILLALEQNSAHPLANAVVTHLRKEIKIEAVRLDHFDNISGKGIRAKAGDELYYAGNLSLLKENNIPVTEDEAKMFDEHQPKAHTLVLLASQKGLLGFLALSDKIKSNSKTAIARLQSLGVSVYMLTGDNAGSAKQIADETGIDNYFANSLPGDKAEFVKKLKSEGRTVAMAGDGINDSQALALADVSIAMGHGSDIARGVAGMTIVSSDLLLIPRAIEISKATVRVIRQNLFWAFIYNIIGIPIAAGVLYPVNGFVINPMIAGAAMALSSVSVVSNSLFLKRKKFYKI